MCRGPDGSYLPILVRLALLIGGDGVASVAEIYQQTFLKLFGRHDIYDNEARKALDEAAQLCLQTFWPTGYRGIAFASADAMRAALLQRLLDAGVLVSTGRVSRGEGRPREVRFFHDSIQSYLTARGLFAKDAWNEFARAAGCPEIRGDSSDGGNGRVSEVFLMCVQVFAPDEKLVAVLRADLEAWSRDCGGDLTRNAVLGTLQSKMRAAVETKLATDAGGGAALREATLLCDAGSDPERIEKLAALYGAIAPLVWPLIAKA